MVLIESAVPSARAIRPWVRNNCILATFGTCSKKILLNSCSLSRIRQIRASERKDLLEGCTLLSFRQHPPFDRLAPYLWSFVRVQLHGHERGSSFFIQCTVLALPKEISHFITADIFVLGLFSLERFNACEFHTILPPHNISWKFRKVQFSASEIRHSVTKGTMAASFRCDDLWDRQGAKSSSLSSSPSSRHHHHHSRHHHHHHHHHHH